MEIPALADSQMLLCTAVICVNVQLRHPPLDLDVLA
jgi:hypothetical protein